MKLESQVCSLELAQKLKALNVKQESLFYWSTYDGGNTKEEPGIVFTDEANHGFKDDLISAFTVAELFEICIQIRAIGFILKRNITGTWVAASGYVKPTGGNGDTPQEALANLIIKLHEDGEAKL